MASDNFADYISIAEAAKRYNVTQAYWYGQIKDKNIPAFKLPGRRGMYLKLSDLAEFWQPKQVNPDDNDDTTA